MPRREGRKGDGEIGDGKPPAKSVKHLCDGEDTLKRNPL